MTIQNSRSLSCGKTKRMNYECGNDPVALLNELGMQRLQDGKTVEAKQSFARALYHSSNALVSGSGSSNVVPAFLLPTYHEYTLTHSEEAGNELQKKTSATSATADVDRSLYIYQRTDYNEGMNIFREALHINKDLPRPVLESTLLYNVGQAYVQSKQYKEAKRWFGTALNLLYGLEDQPGHNYEISSYKIEHNIGYCSYCLGDNKEAMLHYQEALNLARGKLDVAESMNCVAVLNFHQNPSTPEKTLQLFDVSISSYRSIVGDSTPQLATFLSNIGRVHFLMSEYQKSLECFQEALSIRKVVLGSRSIDVATAIFNMGQTFHRLSDLCKAKRCYHQFLDLAKEKLGPVHRDVAAALKSLADAHREEGDLKTALAMLKESLKIGRESLGNHHPELTSTLNDLGSLCYELNAYGDALNYYKECLDVQRNVLESPCHPHIIITLLNIAQIQKQSGECTAAFQTYREVYLLKMQTSPDQDISLSEVASILSSMGLMKYLVKDFTSALNFYLEALSLRRSHYGCDAVQTDIASTLNSIGLVYFKLGMCPQANEAFMECLDLRTKLLGPNHRDISVLYYNVATVLLEFGDDQTALKFYKESLRVERNVLGVNHPEVAQTLKHLGQIHQERGELEEALALFYESLQILRSIECKDTSALSELLNWIGDVHLMRGEIDKMMESFSEACRLMGHDGLALTIAGHSFYDLTRILPPCAPLA